VAESGHGAALPAELLLKVDLKKVQARQARVASERAERHRMCHCGGLQRRAGELLKLDL
jgi:hypothetical protein